MRDEKVNCYHMVIPEYGDGKYWFRPLVRFASESAGSGNLGAPQVTLLQYDILYAYDLDLVKGQRLRSSSAKWASHMTTIIELEPPHIRIQFINMTKENPIEFCSHVCEHSETYHGMLPTALVTCLQIFEKRCTGPSHASERFTRCEKASFHGVGKVFVSGRVGGWRREISMVLEKYFDPSSIDATTFGIDPELVGAYGAACWIQVSAEHRCLRDMYNRNEPVMRGVSFLSDT